MGKKSSENAPIYCVRRGDALIGELQYDRDRIAAMPAGERIKVELSTGRSPSRLRWYWQFLHAVVNATDAVPDAESLHSLVKLNTGYVTPMMVRGMPFVVPRSISFSSMTEEEFVGFLQRAERFIAESYGVTPEDVERAA
ncbi:hypothetical protein CO670_15310 [Rhizobium sp. J15]|uniref:hypothetical protein n=1 Tax=Rhizobium sp. J15 TaxID=2035450 RepID=UPI000BE796EF|nr:hypothetical protein [Rhizobium sp. J15]PDT15863.1 hypothetical protein CO670_15310 [Rhizobium sp. J15]